MQRLHAQQRFDAAEIDQAGVGVVVAGPCYADSDEAISAGSVNHRKVVQVQDSTICEFDIHFLKFQRGNAGLALRDYILILVTPCV